MNATNASRTNGHSLFAFAVSKRVEVDSSHFHAPEGDYDAQTQTWIGDDTIYAASDITCYLDGKVVCTGACYPGYKEDREVRYRTKCKVGK